jgi:ABC-type multidrug transport system fused ATPase/permease subunit
VIKFIRQVLPLMELSARRRLLLASLAMLCLALLEGLALLAIAPLMAILTAPNMVSNSRLVTRLSGWLGHPTPGHLALWLGIAAIVLYVVKDVGAILVARWAIGFFLVQEAITVRRLMHLYLRGPYREHLRENSAELFRTLNSSVRGIFGAGLISGFNAAADMFSVFFVGLILLAANPVVALTAAAYFGTVAFGYQKVVRGILGQSSRALHIAQAKDFQAVRQSLSAIKEIKVRGAEDYYRDEVYKGKLKLVVAYRTMALLNITPRYVLELAMVGATATIAAVTYTTMPVATATSTLGLFLAGGFRIVAPLNKVIFGIGQAHAALPAIDQVQRDIALFSQPTGNKAPKGVGAEWFDQSAPLAKVQPAVVNEAQSGSHGLRPSDGPMIAVRDVRFSYDPGKPVLKGVSFEIQTGEAVGLVGGSGAGKSTMLDILLGLLEPEAGEVLINGRDMASVIDAWRASIGFVPQFISLFDDTVQANVALGVPVDEVDTDDLWRALRLAQLDDVVRGLPEGAETLVGEAGVRLSGGQRQRLGVARALYHRPSILMFDEATSALDNETESRLIEVFENLRGEVTTLTIAHRLSTIRRCDRILYLEDGEMRAEGTFAELNATIPAFAHLVELSDLKLTS